MRAIFLLLLLANIVFFAWTRYFAQPNVSADPAPLARQIEPQKLRVLRPGELPAASSKGTVAAPSAPAPVAATAPTPAQMPGGAGRGLTDQIAAPRRYVENLVLEGLARIALSERKSPAKAAR